MRGSSEGRCSSPRKGEEGERHLHSALATSLRCSCAMAQATVRWCRGPGCHDPTRHSRGHSCAFICAAVSFHGASAPRRGSNRDGTIACAPDASNARERLAVRRALSSTSRKSGWLCMPSAARANASDARLHLSSSARATVSRQSSAFPSRARPGLWSVPRSLALTCSARVPPRGEMFTWRRPAPARSSCKRSGSVVRLRAS